MNDTLKADFAIQEWMNLYPKLRLDLKITFQEQKGQAYYIVEDPSNSRYYRLGILEYKFMSMLDGTKALSEIIVIMIQDMQEQSFDNHEVLQMLNWLNSSNLLQEGVVEDIKKDTLASANEKASFLIFPKFGLGNPNQMIEFLLPFFRFTLGPFFFVLWLGFVISGSYYVFSNWKEFIYNTNDILSLYSVISFAIIWVFLKIVHELWHGLVCKLYGGEVREVGIMLLLLIPLGYVDTSSSWKFPSKWQKIHVSLAGMYIEIFIAAIAAIVWGETNSKIIQQICYNIIILGTITTLFFNLNPLMRFDGHYVLMDLLEEPNLYSRSRAYVAYICKRYVLGVKVTTNAIGIRLKSLLLIYGLMCFVWRILIYFGIFLASSIMLMGVGMIISMAVLLIWLLIPGIKTLRYMLQGTKTEKPNFLRSLTVISCFVGLTMLCYQQFTWQEKIQSPSVFVYKDFETVRCYCPGFVKSLHIETGKFVKKGQLLLTLENREKELEIEELKYDIAIVENFIRQHQNDDEKRIQIQIAEQKKIYYKKSLAEQKALFRSLQIRAPLNGYIYTEDISSLLGKFLHSGEEIIQMYNLDHAVFKAAVLEDDIQQYSVKKGDRVTMYIETQQISFSGKITVVSPKASYEVEHPALTVLGGGDLSVEQSPTAKKEGPFGQYRLAYPHFYLEIEVPQKYKKILRDGQKGYIRIYREKKAIGMLLYYKISKKIKKFYSENL